MRRDLMRAGYKLEGNATPVNISVIIKAFVFVKS
jgi:hypothetical protein